MSPVCGIAEVRHSRREPGDREGAGSDLTIAIGIESTRTFQFVRSVDTGVWLLSRVNTWMLHVGVSSSDPPCPLKDRACDNDDCYACEHATFPSAAEQSNGRCTRP